MKTLTTTILAFVLPIIMIGQNCSSDYKEYLDVNNVKATYYNGGDMFWDLTANPGYVVPANVPSYDQRHSMFAAGIWMGGLDQNGALHQAAQTYRQSGNDYFPGPVRTTGGYGCHATVDLNTPPYFGQLLQHSSGKMLHFYHTGYTITDPGTYNMTPKILPITRSGYQAVELQNGKVLLFGEDKPLAQEATILLDATNFNATVGFQLNHSHTMSTGTVLQNGNVLIAGRFGC